MIERAFEEAQQHKDNRRNALRQFAITQARQLLEAAGVVDPAIRDQAVAARPQKAVEQPFYVIPEGIGIRSTLEIGGKPAQQLEEEMKKASINLSGYAKDMMFSSAFATLEKPTPIELLKLRVQDLGLSGTPTTKQIFERIPQCRVGEMVLDLCPAEVGPHQRLKDTDQPLSDWYYVAMQQISGRYGDPHVFELERDDDGLWLSDRRARPGRRWYPGNPLVVSLRKPEPVKS